MKEYRGVIIEESLENSSLLQNVKILSTKISVAKEKHTTPWLEKWILHSVEIEREKAEEFAREISEHLDETHPGAWYADFDDGEQHYVIFPHNIFRINMRRQEEYDKAREYGVLIKPQNSPSALLRG